MVCQKYAPKLDLCKHVTALAVQRGESRLAKSVVLSSMSQPTRTLCVSRAEAQPAWSAQASQLCAAHAGGVCAGAGCPPCAPPRAAAPSPATVCSCSSPGSLALLFICAPAHPSAAAGLGVSRCCAAEGVHRSAQPLPRQLAADPLRRQQSLPNEHHYAHCTARGAGTDPMQAYHFASHALHGSTLRATTAASHRPAAAWRVSFAAVSARLSRVCSWWSGRANVSTVLRGGGAGQRQPRPGGQARACQAGVCAQPPGAVAPGGARHAGQPRRL